SERLRQPPPRRKRRVVLDHYEPWVELAERLPHPVVLAVHVDREHRRLGRDAALGEDTLDVVRRDGRVDRRHPAVVLVLARQRREAGFVGLDEEPAPAEHVGEEHAVALPPALDSELDEEANAGPDPGEDLGDDAILSMLAEAAKLVFGQRPRTCGAAAL